MTRREFYDWPEEPPRRRQGEEIFLPPEPTVRIRYTTQRDNRVQHWIVVAAIAFVLLILWRSPIGVLMLAIMGGRTMLEALILLPVLLAIVAWRERRAGRPF